MDKTGTASFFFRLLGVVMLLSMLMGADGGVSKVLAETDFWTTSGPGGGHIVSLAIDPSSPATVYAGTWGSGVYKSTDAGGNWIVASTGLGMVAANINAMVIDPQNETTLYVGTYDGVYKSTDGAGSWSKASTGLTNFQVQALAIDPSSPATVYAGTYGGVFKSTNGGGSWSEVNTGLTDTAVWVLAINPLEPAILYAGTGFGGVFKTTNGGETWNAVNTGLMNRIVYSLAIDPITPGTLYVGTNDGVFKSTNEGEIWNTSSTDILHEKVNSLAIDPLTPSSLYAGTDGGIFKSTNAGETWFPANTGLADTSEVYTLAVDPSTPSSLYAGTWSAGGVFKSTDGGNSWTLANRGLANTLVYALAIDPQLPTTLYAGTYYFGVFKSTNGGETWFPVNAGLTEPFVYDLAIDPLSPSTLYAGTDISGVFKSNNGGESWFPANTGLTNLNVDVVRIDPAMPRTLYAGTWGGGLFKSVDGGMNWTAANDGLGSLYVIALAIDPLAPASLYIGTDGGVFKSTNAGENWFPVNTGLTTLSIYSLAIDPATPSTLYAGTYDGGVFKSTNAGGNWFPVDNGMTQTYIPDLAIDPLAPSTLYAATYDGVFKSTNGGNDWTAFNTGLSNTRINVLVVDPVTPATIYAGTDGSGVAKYSSSTSACQAAAGEVVINEILPSPSNNGTEWVELYNTSDHPVGIGSCFIDDIPDAGSPPHQIPAATLLPAHGFWTSDHFSYFNNDGDQVRFLKEDAATVLDSYTFASTGYDRSRYRLPDGGAWAAVTTAFPTKGQTNTLPFYPIVSSSLRTDASPTNAGSVSFTVTFSRAVSGVNLTAPFADFSLTTSGVSGAHISAVAGSGSTYTVTVNTGDADGTIRLNVMDDDTIRDSANKPLGGTGIGNGNFTAGESYTLDKAASFADVSQAHPYWQDIEILYANGLTGGCQTNPLKFCPDQVMNRAQAAAFMLRGNFGPSYVPPTPTHIFKDDWSKGAWAEAWAEGMRKEGFSAGCLASPLKYCPWDQIPREQAVIFALKLKYGKDYMAPPATGTVFADMTNPGFYATAWAEQAYKEGIIPDCGMSGGKPKICPKALVSRGLAAYMIVRAKSLTMP